MMVVEPEGGLSQKIINSSIDLTTGALVSDQTFLQHYYGDWATSPRLHLDEGYNIFTDMLDHYAKNFGYKLFGNDRIAVLHFIGAVKPWHRTLSQQWAVLNDMRRARRFQQLMASMIYILVLVRIRIKKRFTPCRAKFA
jgi:lipopolysaccharide biosynthesis glycosyltransferase